VASSAGLAAANSILYVAPGVNHCSGGEGADTFDMITPLIQWVENEKTPEAITAARLDENGNEELTRPLCEYTAYPKYNGNGSVTDARNFHCTTN
jgi:feruloyl esterase